MNAIERYFKATGDNPSALAERIGRAPSTLTRVIKGERRPSFELALDVERGTNGKVRADVFIGVCLESFRATKAA